jgi:hypothetical protein
MKLTKVDLSSIVAIGHTGNQLGVLIDRGQELEYIEIEAPANAYQGLQQIAYIANEAVASLPLHYKPLKLSHKKSISMVPVKSTMANAVGYDSEQKLLQVEFVNGTTYQYSDVEPETWKSLQEAPSTGKFYNAAIKGHYTCKKLQ